MTQITDLKVGLISLVKAGANRKNVIYKSKDFDERLRVDFTKSDEELGVVYGIVYAPGEVDTQGDWADAATIRAASYDFMKNADLDYCVDTNHNFEIAPAYVCESWIVKEGDSLFKEVGAWAVGIKLESDELKAMIKSGSLGGLSMYASGVRTEAEPSQRGMINAVKSALKEFFNQPKGENVEPQTIPSENPDTNKLDTQSEQIANLAKSVEALSLEVSALKDGLNKSKQNVQINKAETSASKGIL